MLYRYGADKSVNAVIYTSIKAGKVDDEMMDKLTELRSMDMPVIPLSGGDIITLGVPAGKPLEKSSDEHTNALFPFNFFPKSSDGYVIHVSGDSMTGAGISDGDLLLVNKSASPENRDIVVASINGEMTVKRYLNQGDRIVFAPENKNYDPIIATSKDDVDIFGVVVRIIKEPR